MCIRDSIILDNNIKNNIKSKIEIQYETNNNLQFGGGSRSSGEAKTRIPEADYLRLGTF